GQWGGVQPRQPSQRNIRSRYAELPTESLAPGTARRGAISAVSAAGVPKNCPNALTVGFVVPAARRQTENSASGARGANDCQAFTASSADDHGQLRTKWDVRPTA